jgi:hypothetical protein
MPPTKRTRGPNGRNRCNDSDTKPNWLLVPERLDLPDKEIANRSQDLNPVI